MKAPQLKQCCCGCTLETGSLIIGWLDLISSILMILSLVYVLVSGNDAKGGVAASGINSIVLILSAVIHAVIAIMLLIGVKRRLQKYVRIWVLVATVGVIMYFFFTLVQSIMLIVNGNATEGVTSLIGGLLVIALQCYFICVVNSLSRELVAEQQHV